MDFLLLFETWIILAVIFSLSEIFIPGGILLNLGLASLIVSMGVKFELLDTWVITLTTWFISASILLFVIYFFSDRFLNDEKTIENIYDEVDIFGKKVLVTEQIGPGTNAGRVEYQGTTWTALSDGSQIKAGSHATIVCKDNISLVVEIIKE